MELSCKNTLLEEKWILATSKMLFCTAILASFALWSFLIFGHEQEEKVEFVLPKTSIESLGLGVLSLTTPHSIEIQPLLQELVLVGANTRPDQDRICSLALRSSGEEKSVSVGETVYFEMKEGHFVFSKDKTDLCMIARALEGNQMVCEIKNQNISESCIISSSTIFSKALDQEPYVEILKKGGVWGKDIFLSGWGGDEYREMGAKVKVSLGPEVYFLKSGDCLWWNGDMWVEQLQSSEAAPIAQVIKANGGGATLQVWDSKGFSSQTVHLSTQTSPKPSLKLEELMTSIRPRSASEITCQLGKRRVIVREGDWWIRSGDRWKPLRSTSDLEALLTHQIQGELFIFEKIEASKGNVILKGLAFDQMRTSSEPVSIVMETEKKPTTTHRPSTGSAHLAKQRSRHPIVSHSEEL